MVFFPLVVQVAREPEAMQGAEAIAQKGDLP
jgi:hypothetical protein